MGTRCGRLLRKLIATWKPGTDEAITPPARQATIATRSVSELTTLSADTNDHMALTRRGAVLRAGAGLAAVLGGSTLAHATTARAQDAAPVATLTDINFVAVGQTGGGDTGLIGFDASSATANFSNGVWGNGTENGVYGETSGGIAGVHGFSSTGVGILGASGSPDGIGVEGTGHIAVKGFGGTGVQGFSTDPGGTGVEGRGEGFGVRGLSYKVGVQGTSNGYGGEFQGDNAGVRSQSDSGLGLDAFSGSGTAVQGTSDGGIGVNGTSNGKHSGVVGISAGANGVHGMASVAGSAGVFGESDSGYGGCFQGGTAPLRLVPSASTGAPTEGTHAIGELVIDQTGSLFICVADGTPGTWMRVMYGSP